MVSRSQGRERRQSPRRRAALVGTLMVALIAVAPPAFAHGEGESVEAYALVQQALAHLAHSTERASVMDAMEKVDDALATEDQEGVNVAGVEQAQAALESGDIEEARSLLQDSITDAISALAPAVGEETGTTVLSDVLPGRSGLAGVDIGFLIASIALLVVGAVLSWRFRPSESVSELRARLARPESTTIDEKSPQNKEEAK